MTSRQDIFGALGRVSVLFSSLEAELGDLLCILVDQEDPMLAATLLEGNSFAKTLELLKKVARFRGTTVEARVSRLQDIAVPLRSKRNLFVHGCWDISSELLEHGKVIVRDSKIDFHVTGNRKSWRKGKDHTLTYEQLRDYESEVMRALKMTRELLETLHELEDKG